ncbi:MAG: transglutaminase TgpA family protein [Betaproteobacteria bacterium]
MSSAAGLPQSNVAALIFSLALVMAPHTQHLPLWIPAFGATVLLARLYLGYRRKPLPNRWLLLAVALATVAGVALSYRTLYGRDVGVALLTVMAALKVMEMSKPRDTMAVVLLAYFIVITNFFYSQSIPTALYMLVIVWLITATMISLQRQTGAPAPAAVLRHAASLIAQGIPVMLALFLLFPRVQGPLWGLPQVNYGARAGLSNVMSPGDVSALSLSDDVAFRVLFETPPQKPSQLYWRGPVLWDFDGRAWRAGQIYTVDSFDYEALGPPLIYTVTLEPHDQRWMFAVDLPSRAAPNSYFSSDYQMLARRPVRERIRYDVRSIPSYRAGVNEQRMQLRRALRLPDGAAPRAQALAASWRADTSGHRDIMRRALTMFREQPFTYTLAPPELGDNPVDQFLFETRSGFCEHYASAFTYLMRAAGVPARVVTGYLGGEMNPVDGYLIVRQSEAHAWTEVWLSGEGWVRVDPTAAVSPLRIESGLAAAVPETDQAILGARNRLEWLRQTRFAWDAVANAWNQWVLGYNPERQVRFLSQMGLAQATWQNMVIALIATSGIILLVLAALLLVRLTARRMDPVQRAYARYCQAMARRGAPRKPSEGPRDFAARVSLQFPHLRDTVQRIATLYVALRYGGEKNPRVLEQFRRAVTSLR